MSTRELGRRPGAHGRALADPLLRALSAHCGRRAATVGTCRPQSSRSLAAAAFFGAANQSFSILVSVSAMRRSS